MNITELRSAVDQLRSEIDELSTLDDITPEQDARLDEAIAEFEARKGELDKAEARAAKVEAIRSLETTATPSVRESLQVMKRVEVAPPTEVRDLSRGERREQAMKVLERAGDFVSDGNREHVARQIARNTKNFDGDYIAERLLITESDEYRSAFAKRTVIGDGAALTPEETRAVAAFQELEMRAASTTNSAGGYGIPVLIDPSIIITSGAADAPVLTVCRVETITNNVWKGVSSQGVTWSFDAEASAVSDDAATLAQPTVTAYTARGFIPYSIEIGMDYPGFAAEMQRLLSAGYLDLLAAKTATGAGSTEPTGIFTAAHANTNVQVVVTTDGSFGAVDVFKVWNALPERYRGRASWFMNVSVESQIRAFAAAAGSSSAYFTVDLTADGISRINGRPVIKSDYAPAFLATTGATQHLVVGDFSNYLVAQRAGMNLELIPMLFDVTNNRPTGSRGWFAWARVGANSVNDLGFRILENQ